MDALSNLFGWLTGQWTNQISMWKLVLDIGRCLCGFAGTISPGD